MIEQKLPQNNNQDAQFENPDSPDYSQIREKPDNSKIKKVVFLILKIIGIIAIALILLSVILGFVYYRNIMTAKDLSYSAKVNLEEAAHKMVNRDFKEAAALINKSNGELNEAKDLLDEIIIVRHIPYVGDQLKAVDQVLIAGINLTESGEKIVLLIDDIVKPLANESITYAEISPQQKKDILNKIVSAEGLLLDVQKQINDANEAVSQINTSILLPQLKEPVVLLQDTLPTMKRLVDSTIPMITVVPKVVGFEEPKTYLFLLQNNSELRPTGGFIGTYGVLKLENGEIVSFDTDNIYNLDRAPQYIIAEPSPAPIAKYLEQPYLSLRDVNWSPDFPTTAEKALYFYDKDYWAYNSLKEEGKVVVGEEDIEIVDIIPYEPKIDGVIAMTPEILGDFLELTGPVVINGRMFDSENFQTELEYIVGREFRELQIPVSERKDIIKQLSDQIILKIMSLPAHKAVDVAEIVFNNLDKKSILIYSKDEQLEQMVLDRGWGGQIEQTDGDYLMVVDSNLASLKTDQFVEREINYNIRQQGNNMIAKVDITYHNNATFDWRSSRLRTYTRVYAPLGSQLISSSGAMEDDKIKDPEGHPGQVDTAEEFGKTYFGAFIAIEPQESGVLSFEYKLSEKIKQQIEQAQYTLLIQKQPGVVHDLTLDLNFDKTIKSAQPEDMIKALFDKNYNYSEPLLKDTRFEVSF